jgi:hypothetical protein
VPVETSLMVHGRRFPGLTVWALASGSWNGPRSGDLGLRQPGTVVGVVSGGHVDEWASFGQSSRLAQL